MDLPTIRLVFLASFILTILSFWLHRRLAGTEGRPGPVSMALFVLGWLAVLTAICTGAFLLLVAVRR
jgi:hypothetical protein